MAKNRKSAWKRAKVWRDMAHSAKVAANASLVTMTEMQPNGRTRDYKLHSATAKPYVGFQGTYRGPRQVGEGADAPAFYKAGAKAKQQRLPKATRLFAPNQRAHDRSNLPKP